jgi:protein farnesyltransferase/geranylgeranyltransferase type-1 subunit alpha
MSGKRNPMHLWKARFVTSYGILPLWSFLDVSANNLIEEDPRNNSAWNDRWFAIHRGKQGDPISFDLARQEADFAIDSATKDPFNESPWRYLIGILREQWTTGKIIATTLAEYEAKSFHVGTVLVEADHDPEACFNLTSTRIDLLEMIGSGDSLAKVRTKTEIVAPFSKLK